MGEPLPSSAEPVDLGMPLRDWLASKALVGSISCKVRVLDTDTAGAFYRLPPGCYAIADLMIEARGASDAPPSLRDFFAGEVLQKLLETFFPDDCGADPVKARAAFLSLAQRAYGFGDELAARRLEPKP